MITIQFPDAVKPHMLRRLILFGIGLALAGLALSLYKGDILRDFFSDSQGLFLLKTLLLVIGSVFIVIGLAGLLPGKLAASVHCDSGEKTRAQRPN